MFVVHCFEQHPEDIKSFTMTLRIILKSYFSRNFDTHLFVIKINAIHKYALGILELLFFKCELIVHSSSNEILILPVTCGL
jgi:hypothetical protein